MNTIDKNLLKEYAERYTKAREISEAAENRYLDCNRRETEEREYRKIRMMYLEADGLRDTLACLIADIIVNNLEEITGEKNGSE